MLRIKLNNDISAKVHSLIVYRSDNAKPYLSSQRKKPPAQSDFIMRTILELDQAGAISKKNAVSWKGSPLAVPKPCSKKIRFTIDFRGPNSRTVLILSAMPHLIIDFLDISEGTCFASIDLAHGYRQIPLSDEPQELSFIQSIYQSLLNLLFSSR